MAVTAVYPHPLTQFAIKSQSQFPKVAYWLPPLPVLCYLLFILLYGLLQAAGGAVVQRFRSRRKSWRAAIGKTIHGTSGTNGARWPPKQWDSLHFGGVTLVASVALVPLVARIPARPPPLGLRLRVGIIVEQRFQRWTSFLSKTWGGCPWLRWSCPVGAAKRRIIYQNRSKTNVELGLGAPTAPKALLLPPLLNS